MECKFSRGSKIASWRIKLEDTPYHKCGTDHIMSFMEDSPMVRGIGGPTKTIDQYQQRFRFKWFTTGFFYEKTLWHCLIHVANTTKLEKALIVNVVLST